VLLGYVLELDGRVDLPDAAALVVDDHADLVVGTGKPME
jgi:hypothetical protein